MKEKFAPSKPDYTLNGVDVAFKPHAKMPYERYPIDYGYDNVTAACFFMHDKKTKSTSIALFSDHNKQLIMIRQSSGKNIADLSGHHNSMVAFSDNGRYMIAYAYPVDPNKKGVHVIEHFGDCHVSENSNKRIKKFHPHIDKKSVLEKLKQHIEAACATERPSKKLLTNKDEMLDYINFNLAKIKNISEAALI